MADGDGVKVDYESMYAAADLIETKRQSLQEKYDNMIKDIKTKIGPSGSIWNGQKAKEFIDYLDSTYPTEYQKLNDNIAAAGKNIKDQAQAWYDFDHQ